MSQETQRTFTQEQQNRMYEALRILVIRKGALNNDRLTLGRLSLKAALDNAETLLQEIEATASASTPAAVASEPGSGAGYPRYVLELADSTNGVADAWSIVDNETGRYVAYKIYASEDTMQTEADRLNAAQPASGNPGAGE